MAEMIASMAQMTAASAQDAATVAQTTATAAALDAAIDAALSADNPSFMTIYNLMTTGLMSTNQYTLYYKFGSMSTSAASDGTHSLQITQCG